MTEVYNYRDYHWENSNVIKAKKVVKSLFECDEIEQDFLGDLSSFLHAGNPGQKIRIWIGGRESIIVKLLEVILGTELVHIPTDSLFNASPDWLKADGAHVIICGSDNKPIEWTSANMKHLACGDPFFVKPLYEEEDGIILTPIFKPIIVCDQTPIVKESGPALHRRLKVFSFLPITENFTKEEILEIAKGLYWIMNQ
jgi:hypothetical protein